MGLQDQVVDKTEGPISLSSTQLQYEEKERRKKQRVFESFPIRVRGTDANGEAFELDTVLDNISASGLYVRLPGNVERGANLFILVKLSRTDAGTDSAPLVALRGKVRRTKQESNGFWGVAVEFTGHRFI